MTPVVLQGMPVRLDLFLRPAVRTIQLVVGILPSFALAYFGYLWLAPLPLAASFLGYERFFASRRDTPIRLTLGDTLSMVDRTADRTLELDPAQVHAVSVHHRLRGEGQREVVLVLCSTDAVLFSCRFFVAEEVKLPATAIDVEVMDELLGGYGGLVAPTAAPAARCRQTIRDLPAAGLAWFQEHLPAEAWNRQGIRVWRGSAPALDNFGLHTDEPTGLLVIDGDRWSLGEQQGDFHNVTVQRTHRTVELARQTREDEQIEAGQIIVEDVHLPVLVVALTADLHVAIPAPIAAAAADEIDAHDALLHCHVPEGGALLWSYFSTTPMASWPAPLQEQVGYVLGDRRPWQTSAPTPDDALR